MRIAYTLTELPKNRVVDSLLYNYFQLSQIQIGRLVYQVLLYVGKIGSPEFRMSRFFQKGAFLKNISTDCKRRRCLCWAS